MSIDIVFAVRLVGLYSCFPFVIHAETSNHSDVVVRVGHVIQPCSAVAHDVTGKTFLLNDVTFPDGVLFAISAYIAAQSPVRFQVWRLVGVGRNPENFTDARNGMDGDFFQETARHTYRLMEEARFTPSMTSGREDFYLSSQPPGRCVRVRRGDRLAVYYEQSPGGICYSFDASRRALLDLLSDSTRPNLVGQPAVFDSLSFPYDISMAAYVQSSVDANVTVYEAQDDDSSDLVDCPLDVVIPGDENLLLNEAAISQVVGVREPAVLNGNDKGMAAAENTSADDTNNSIWSPGAQGNTGATGATGLPGPDGIPGATGLQGPKGENGEPTIYLDSADKSDSSTADLGLLSSPNIILGLIIWLAILSVLFLAAVLVAVVFMLKYRAQAARLSSTTYRKSFESGEAAIPYYSTPADRVLPGTSSDPAERRQGGEGLKEEAEGYYSNDTVEHQMHQEAAVAAKTFL